MKNKSLAFILGGALAVGVSFPIGCQAKNTLDEITSAKQVIREKYYQGAELSGRPYRIIREVEPNLKEVREEFYFQERGAYVDLGVAGLLGSVGVFSGLYGARRREEH